MGPSITVLVAKLGLSGQCDFSQPVAGLCAVLGSGGEQVSETVCNVLPSPRTETVQLASTGVLPHTALKMQKSLKLFVLLRGIPPKTLLHGIYPKTLFAAYLRKPIYAAYLRKPFFAAYLRKLF